MSETTSKLYQAIHAQPQAIRTLLAENDSAQEVAQRLAHSKRVFVAGIGTSFHAATIGEYLLRLAGAEAWAVRSFEFVTYPRPLSADDAVIVISHRGSKTYGALALQRAHETGVTTVGITGKNSKMQGADLAIETVEQDPSSTHSISYTASLTRLGQIAAHLARLSGKPEQAETLEQGLARVPELMEGILAREEEIRQVAREAATNQRRIYFIGAGPNAASAWEGALKAKESSYITAEGFELEQALHGPLVAFEKEDLVIPINIAGKSQSRTRDLLLALGEIGTRTLLLGDDPQIDFSQHAGWARFALQDGDGLSEGLTPLLAAVPVQLLADFLATVRRIDADGFRLNEAAYGRAFNHIRL